jgi:hypothetical protein
MDGPQNPIVLWNEYHRIPLLLQSCMAIAAGVMPIEGCSDHNLGNYDAARGAHIPDVRLQES